MKDQTMKTSTIAAAVLALCAATAAQAIPRIIDTEAPEAPEPSASTPAPLGPFYIFGKHNTKQTVLVLDATTASLCNMDTGGLTGCRPAVGLATLRRSKQLQVAQLLKWDRSGMFGVNASELIACFQYFDSPSTAYFSCQTATATGLDSASLTRDMTALAWRAYTAAGLRPQSADKVNALYAKRKSTTAYVKANGVLPPDRKKALETDDEETPPATPTPPDPPPPEAVELETVVVTGDKPVPEPTPADSTIFDTVVVTGKLPRDPLIIIDECTTFAICAAPPPPPPPEFPMNPPKVCSAECNTNASLMNATCGATGFQLASGFAIAAPVSGVVVGTGFGNPALGWTVFKSVSKVGGSASATWTAACFGLTQMRQATCLAEAKKSGC